MLCEKCSSCILRANLRIRLIWPKKEKEMKLLLTLLLGLTSLHVQAAPKTVYSEVCGREYVEGEKTIDDIGRTYYKCYEKSSLPKVYFTDIDSECSDTHAASRHKYDFFRGTTSKECRQKDSLGSAYPVDKVNGYCIDGYHSTNIVHRNYSRIYAGYFRTSVICRKSL